MLWSGADNTNAVWGDNDWAGRIREERAELYQATGRPTLPSSNTESIGQAIVTESATVATAGDSFSTTLDFSTTIRGSTFIIDTKTRTTSTELAKQVGTVATAQQLVSGTTALTDSSLYQAIPTIGSNVGIGIANPAIIEVGVQPSISRGSETTNTIDSSPPATSIAQPLPTIESSAVTISPGVVTANALRKLSDEISRSGDTATLSVVASSGSVAADTSIAAENISIRVPTVSTSIDISDTDGTTSSLSDSAEGATATTATTELATGLSTSSDIATPTVATSVPTVSFEIYSAIEDANIVPISASALNTKNLLTVSPDAIVSVVGAPLLSDSQQINSSIDYTEIENETNIVTLEPSSNGVIIDE